jgi:hypothetical protein
MPESTATTLSYTTPWDTIFPFGGAESDKVMFAFLDLFLAERLAFRILTPGDKGGIEEHLSDVPVS